MAFEVKFNVSNQSFTPSFGEVHNISDGGFERGYAAGYEEGNTEGYTKGHTDGVEQGYADGVVVGEASGNAVADSIVERTITEFVNHRITKIGGYAFARHSGLVGIDIPNVETIEQYGFNYCTGLTEIELPKVKTIANQAFNSCGKLTKVDAPMLEKIDGYSFTGSQLSTLIIRQADKVCNLTSVSAIRSTPIESGSGYIYVPDVLVAQYKAAANWSTYAAQIKPISELEGET